MRLFINDVIENMGVCQMITVVDDRKGGVIQMMAHYSV